MNKPMNPAERLAALRLLESGLKDAITKAAADAEAYMQQVGADRMRTPWGPLSATTRKPSITWINDRTLIEWAELNDLGHLVQKTIPYESKRWLVDKYFKISGDDVVEIATGVIVDYAAVKPASAGLSFRPSDDAKTEATQAVLERVELLFPAAIEAPTTDSEDAA